MMKQTIINVVFALGIIVLLITVNQQNTTITAQSKTITALMTSQEEQAGATKQLADNLLLTTKAIKAITDTQKSQGSLNVAIVKAITNK